MNTLLLAKRKVHFLFFFLVVCVLAHTLEGEREREEEQVCIRAAA